METRMIQTFEATSIAECARLATEWLQNEGHTYRVSNTQIHKVKGYSHTYVLVLTCESWYNIAKYKGA